MTDALTLFEFWTTGHAPNFVRLIVEAWRKHDIGCLRVVVPQRFASNINLSLTVSRISPEAR